MPEKLTLERAFELAASGKPATVEHIRKQLRAEGYDANQIVGASLLRQLRLLIARAKSKTAGQS